MNVARAVLVSLIGFGIVAASAAELKKTPSRATASFVYTANFQSAVPASKKVSASGISWNCSGNRCQTTGPWAVPGVGACAALAGQVGTITEYGHPGAKLSAADLELCNRSAKASAAVRAKPLATAAPGARTAQVAPAAHNQIRQKQQQFEQLRTQRERADQQAKTVSGATAMRASGNQSAVTTNRNAGVKFDASKIRLSSKREMMGYTHKHGQGQDCDDTNRSIHPNAAETCDNKDNNCDGAVDEGQKMLFFLDADGDGHGDPAQRIEACPMDQRAAADSGRWLVPVGNDCDDTDPGTWQACE